MISIRLVRVIRPFRVFTEIAAAFGHHKLQGNLLEKGGLSCSPSLSAIVQGQDSSTMRPSCRQCRDKTVTEVPGTPVRAVSTILPPSVLQPEVSSNVGVFRAVEMQRKALCKFQLLVYVHVRTPAPFFALKGGPATANWATKVS